MNAGEIVIDGVDDVDDIETKVGIKMLIYLSRQLESCKKRTLA